MNESIQPGAKEGWRYNWIALPAEVEYIDVGYVQGLGLSTRQRPYRKLRRSTAEIVFLAAMWALVGFCFGVLLCLYLFPVGRVGP